MVSQKKFHKGFLEKSTSFQKEQKKIEPGAFSDKPFSEN